MKTPLLIFLFLPIFVFSQTSYNMSNTTVYTCDATIYDDGGPSGNYTETNYEMTVCASAGSVLYILVPVLQLGQNAIGQSDILMIYEGTGTTGSVLFDSNVNSAPTGIIVANASCITITIDTNPNQWIPTNVGPGFEINVSCIPPETCSDGILNNGEVMIDCGGPNCLPCYVITECGPEVIFNGGFETTTASCANGTSTPTDGQMYTNVTNVGGWWGSASSNGMNSGITPDYWNTNCVGNNTVSCFGSDGAVGVFTGTGSGNVREYIQSQLVTPLEAGAEYCLNVDVYGHQPSDGLGFWFHNMGILDVDQHNGSVSFFGPGTSINGTPQVENPSGNIFGNFCSNLTLSFCASGGEQYVTVGNFKTDANTLPYPPQIGYLVIDNLTLKKSCPPSFDLDIIASNYTPDCINDIVELTAMASNFYGGCQITDDLTYIWSTGETTQNIFVTPPVNSPYTVSVTYNTGCQSVTISETISFNCGLEIDLTGDTICEGEAGYVTAYAFGSSGYSFEWSGGGITGNTASNPNSNTQTDSPTTTTNYYVTVTDNYGNSVVDSTQIVVFPKPEYTTLTNDVSCYGLCDGTVSISHTSGTPPYSYQWDANASNQTSNPAINLCAGIYSVTVTDDNLCSTTSAVTINEPLPLIVEIGNDTSICSVDSLVLDAGVWSSYNWSPSGNTQTLLVTISGVYSVTVTDINGCQGVDSINIIVFGQMDATITPAGPVCSNDPAFNLTPADPGGTWNGNGITSTTNGTFSPAVAGVGTHTIIYTIPGSCGDSDTTDIVVNVSPVVDLGADTTLCYGDALMLNAGPASIYSWSPSGNSQTINVTSSGIYSVTVTDINGCSGTDQIQITVLNMLTANISPDNYQLCEGDNTSLTATTNGNNPIYQWNTGQTSASININPSTTTSYTVTVSDNFGCSASAQTTVVVNAIPNVDFEAIPLSGCVPFTVDFFNTGDSGSSLWSFGDGSSSSDINPSHSYNTPGEYTVSLTISANGCSALLSIPDYISVYPIPVSAFYCSSNMIYDDGTIVFFADASFGANSWLWDFGTDNALDFSNLQNPNFLFPEAGEYQVWQYVENQWGCKDSSYHTILVKPTISFYIPNAFSPNGDGVNDEFHPFGMNIDVDEYQMLIYDRWGKLMFKSNNVNSAWDGTSFDSNGEILTQGVYTYLISYSANGVNKVKKGVVTLLH